VKPGFLGPDAPKENFNAPHHDALRRARLEESQRTAPFKEREMNPNAILALILYRDMGSSEPILTDRERKMIFEVFGNRANAERIAREWGARDAQERRLEMLADLERKARA
jgi:hypothetical protein